MQQKGVVKRPITIDPDIANELYINENEENDRDNQDMMSPGSDDEQANLQYNQNSQPNADIGAGGDSPQIDVKNIVDESSEEDSLPDGVNDDPDAM